MFRNLLQSEIKKLTSHDNRAENWQDIKVCDPFDPDKIRKSSFHGEVYIGPFNNTILKRGSLVLPVGIYNSNILSSVIGADCAVHNTAYLSGYTLEKEVILFNIDEMSVSTSPVFGTGLAGENGSRTWISAGNENGGRSILPFRTIKTSDCFLWAKHRENKNLIEKFILFTEREEKVPDFQAAIGRGTTIRSCRIIEDTRIGSFAQITGANLLKNLTINSSRENPTEIGVGSELVNGIVGEGAAVIYDAKAHNFVLGSHSKLQNGARFFDSFLGENSTIACCEVQSSLIFPFHEQHHNNSFLIASTLQGQSNIAAGATIGSNHNSRGADGEILAERGFWPALSSSLKHNCRFAAFILLSKADYPYEMNIELPFSLVSQNEAENHLQIMPAYWFMYNMYALARNSWKFSVRDKRKDKSQHIEFNYLAPDTVEEIFKSLELLTLWTGKAWYTRYRSFTDFPEKEEIIDKGRKILASTEGEIMSLEVLGEDIENSNRKVVILKADKAYRIYRDMIHSYAVKNIVAYASENGLSLTETAERFRTAERSRWINLGGQLVREDDLASIKSAILKGQISSWGELHRKYIDLSRTYPEDRTAHAFASLMYLYGRKGELPPADFWKDALAKGIEIQEMVVKNTYESRLKDYTNKFRRVTFDSTREMKAVTGTIDDNNFIDIIKEELADFKTKVSTLII